MKTAIDVKKIIKEQICTHNKAERKKKTTLSKNKGRVAELIKAMKEICKQMSPKKNDLVFKAFFLENEITLTIEDMRRVAINRYGVSVKKHLTNHQGGQIESWHKTDNSNPQVLKQIGVAYNSDGVLSEISTQTTTDIISSLVGAMIKNGPKAKRIKPKQAATLYP